MVDTKWDTIFKVLNSTVFALVPRTAKFLVLVLNYSNFGTVTTLVMKIKYIMFG